MINDQGLLIVIVAIKVTLLENLIAWLSQDPTWARFFFVNLQLLCKFYRVTIISIILITLIALGTIDIYSLQAFDYLWYIKTS